MAPLSGSRRTIAPHRHNPAEAGRRWRGKRSLEPLVISSAATTDALFAYEVERKVRNFLAHLSAARSSLDHAKHGHRDAAWLRRPPFAHRSSAFQIFSVPLSMSSGGDLWRRRDKFFLVCRWLATKAAVSWQQHVGLGLRPLVL